MPPTAPCKCRHNQAHPAVGPSHGRLRTPRPLRRPSVANTVVAADIAAVAAPDAPAVATASGPRRPVAVQIAAAAVSVAARTPETPRMPLTALLLLHRGAHCRGRRWLWMLTTPTSNAHTLLLPCAKGLSVGFCGVHGVVALGIHVTVVFQLSIVSVVFLRCPCCLCCLVPLACACLPVNFEQPSCVRQHIQSAPNISGALYIDGWRRRHSWQVLAIAATLREQII